MHAPVPAAEPLAVCQSPASLPHLQLGERPIGSGFLAFLKIQQKQALPFGKSSKNFLRSDAGFLIRSPGLG
jgi:hypothetical protein